MGEKIICSMDGVAIYGIISICIFVTFFLGMLWWVCTKKAGYLNKMASLPLEGGETSSNDQSNAESL